MFVTKEIIGYLSILVAIVATVPYCRLMYLNKAKPHVFTWFIWALIMGISAAARDAAHAGPGAWGAWAGGTSCFLIALYALFKGEKNITRSDTISFVVALLAIPLWLATGNPLTAVIIVTSIEVVAYYPTVRKSYRRPHEELTYNYMVANSLHLMSMLANNTLSLTTMLTPVTLFTANTALIIFIFWRRKQLPLLKPVGVN
jgi:hypothetical protein